MHIQPPQVCPTQNATTPQTVQRTPSGQTPCSLPPSPTDAMPRSHKLSELQPGKLPNPVNRHRLIWRQYPIYRRINPVRHIRTPPPRICQHPLPVFRVRHRHDVGSHFRTVRRASTSQCLQHPRRHRLRINRKPGQPRRWRHALRHASPRPDIHQRDHGVDPMPFHMLAHQIRPHTDPQTRAAPGAAPNASSRPKAHTRNTAPHSPPRPHSSADSRGIRYFPCTPYPVLHHTALLLYRIRIPHLSRIDPSVPIVHPPAPAQNDCSGKAYSCAATPLRVSHIRAIVASAQSSSARFSDQEHRLRPAQRREPLDAYRLLRLTHISSTPRLSYTDRNPT